MKREATNGITTIVVEPGDERAHVLATLPPLAGQCVIVALLDDAVFRRPGDLRELGQAADQINIGLTLIIASNEPLRLWARAQGFTVFSSLETYTRSWSSSPASSLPAPKTSGQFKVPGVPLSRQITRITEPLYKRPEALHMLDLANNFSSGNRLYPPTYIQNGDTPFTNGPLIDTPVGIQLIDVQKALHKQIAEEKAQESLPEPFSLLSNAELPVSSASVQVQTKAKTQPETVDLAALPAWETPRTIWHDRLLFILVALLALGIMGGLSFGYLLSMAHGAPAPLLPAALSLIYQVVHP